jgi:hypothetical protein
MVTLTVVGSFWVLAAVVGRNVKRRVLERDDFALHGDFIFRPGHFSFGCRQFKFALGISHVKDC